MKVISLTVLHYGREYLGAALTSVIDHVDEAWVLYTDKGSHGARTDIPCPETESELHQIAAIAAGHKLRWHKGEYSYEGQHREKIHELAPDADVIVTLDADEIWPQVSAYPGGLRDVFESATKQDDIWSFRWPMIHAWRSLSKLILYDPAFPQRVTVVKNIGKTNRIEVFPSYVKEDGFQQRPIVHCGYAQTPAIVEYKWRIHGHIGELRRDVNWFQDVYMNKARSTDLHPVGSDAWNYEIVQPEKYYPRWMKFHPFWGKEWIE